MTELNAITNTNTETNTYYAQPYDISATGFWFSDYDTFCEKLNAHHCEEFELQYIDGDDAELWNACGISMADLSLWFDVVLEREEYEKVSLFYCCDDLGMSLEQALDSLEDYPVSEGTAKDYAYYMVEDCGMLDGLPEHLQCYFDYDAFARDMQYNGDITEFEYNGTTYTATQ